MDILIDNKIVETLEQDFKKFKSNLFDLEEEFYEEYKRDKDESIFYNYFIYAIINEKSVFKKVYKKLLDNGCDKKKVNLMFYNHLKFQHKCNTMQWSFNEVEELDLNIPIETDIKFSNYKFF